MVAWMCTNKQRTKIWRHALLVLLRFAESTYISECCKCTIWCTMHNEIPYCHFMFRAILSLTDGESSMQKHSNLKMESLWSMAIAFSAYYVFKSNKRKRIRSFQNTHTLRIVVMSFAISHSRKLGDYGKLTLLFAFCNRQ